MYLSYPLCDLNILCILYPPHSSISSSFIYLAGTNYQITLDGQGLLDSAAYTEGIPVEVNVQVSNPNSYALDANKIQADIRVPDADNTLIASVKHEGAIHIPKQETGKVFDIYKCISINIHL